MISKRSDTTQMNINTNDKTTTPNTLKVHSHLITITSLFMVRGNEKCKFTISHDLKYFFHWHACKISKLSICIAKCSIAINKIYIFTFHSFVGCNMKYWGVSLWMKLKRLKILLCLQSNYEIICHSKLRCRDSALCGRPYRKNSNSFLPVFP